jgi:hypothetical protein
MADAGYNVEVTSSQLTGGPIGIVPKSERATRNSAYKRRNFRIADHSEAGLCLPTIERHCPVSTASRKACPNKLIPTKTFGSKPMDHLRMRRFISLVGNLLNPFL